MHKRQKIETTGTEKMEIIKKIMVSGGVLHKCKHKSSVVKTDMNFSVFIPPQAAMGKVPVLYYLSGQYSPESGL